MLDVLHRLVGRPAGRPDRRPQAEPSQATPVDAGNQLFDAIKREFPFMSDECIRKVISEM